MTEMPRKDPAGGASSEGGTGAERPEEDPLRTEFLTDEEVAALETRIDDVDAEETAMSILPATDADAEATESTIIDAPPGGATLPPSADPRSAADLPVLPRTTAETSSAPSPALAAALRDAQTELDQDLAGKFRAVGKAKQVEKGQRVTVVKVGDVVKVARDLLGAMASKTETELQDELVKRELRIDSLQRQLALANERLLVSEAAGRAGEAREATARAEGERLRAELAEAAPARTAALAARDEVIERCRFLEGLVPTGPAADALREEEKALRALIAELELRVLGLRSEHQYAQLVEEPPFAELADAARALSSAAVAAPGVAGEQAAAAAAAIVALVEAADGEFREAFREILDRRGAVRHVARLETIAGVGREVEKELARWQRVVAGAVPAGQGNS